MTDHVELLRRLEMEFRLNQIPVEREYQALRKAMIEQHGEAWVKQVEQEIKENNDGRPDEN